VRTSLKTLLVLCLVGTGIAILGAALRTSNVQEREEAGVLIHRLGMTVMLIGFAGLFLLRKGTSHKRKVDAFQWSDVGGKLSLVPIARREILNVSLDNENQESALDLDTCELQDVRCVFARGRSIQREFVSRLAKHQQVRVLDVQNATLGDDVLQELEKLECLEVILLAGCLEPAQTKTLRMALPELRMIFDPR
jgi:hypothetical protein